MSARRWWRGWFAVGVVAASLVCAAPAVARWTGLSTGSGSAGTGGTVQLTLAPGTPSAQLVPGGQAAVVVSVTNSSSTTVRVGSLALDTTQGSSGFAVDGGHTGCVLSALSFTTQTNGGAGWVVAGHTTLPITLSGSLSMSTGAANACQGATFTVYLRVAS
jgi:hypothetical protein